MGRGNRGRVKRVSPVCMSFLDSIHEAMDDSIHEAMEET